MKKRYWLAILCAVLALVLTLAAASADAGDEYRLMTDDSALHDGDRVILVSDDGSYYQAMATDFSGVQVTVTDNAITEQDGMLVLTLSETDGGWLLAADGGYLAVDDGSLTVTIDDVSAAVWSISIVSNGTATISCTDGNLVFAEQDGGYRFACGDGGNELAIYNATFEPEQHAFGDGLWWTFSNGELTIGGSGDMPYFLYPSNEPWTTDQPWYFLHGKIIKIVIQDGVTSIGAHAFRDCTELSEIMIPHSVTNIGYEAFYKCTGLSEITIPDSVTSIDSIAFYGCTGLSEITIPDGVTSIGSGAFSGCTGLRSVTIGNGVTSIGSSAFYGCTGLESVIIPDNVTSIGDYAFQSCTGLSEIMIPDSVTSIGSGAFSSTGWWNAQNDGVVYIDHILLGVKGTYGQIIRIQDDTRLIADGAFSYKTQITKVTIPDSVTSISPKTFYSCTGLMSVTIGNGLTSIGYQAFCHCTGLTSVTIPDSVTSIGEYAFESCTGLTSITIPDSVTSISEHAFYGCTELESVTIGNGMTNINKYTFAGCTGLTSITIPDSVTSIGDYAFQSCTGLQKITIGNGVTSIGVAAFYGCTSLSEIIIPDNVTSIGGSAFRDCTGLTSVMIGNGVTRIGFRMFYDCKGLTSVTMPCSASIGEDAFYACTAIKSVHLTVGTGMMADLNWSYNYYAPWYISRNNTLTIVLDEGIQNIGIHTFAGCTGLTEITIPDSVTSIGKGAFNDCTGLTSITIGKGVKYLSGFSGCMGLTEITIPDGVTSIGEAAFARCTELVSITIGNGVTSIEESAFYQCTGLMDVYYHGTRRTRNSISIDNFGYYNDYLKKAAWHYLSPISIEMKTLPNKLSYQEGESLYVTGGSITTYYNYDITEEETLTVEMVSGFDNTKAGTQTLTVTFDGQATTFDVTVTHIPGEPVIENKVNPTCTEKGCHDEVVYCTYCGEELSREMVEDDALGHDLVHHEAKDPTCTEIGWEAYDTCTRCDYTTYVEVPALGHDLVHHDAKDPTCTEIGWEEYDTCTRCNYTTYVEIPALGHHLVHHDAQDPTCIEIGWEAYDTCTRCDYTTYVEIPALGHDLVHHDAQEPTCTVIGWEAYDTCTRCNYTTYVEIPALGHDLVHHNAQEPTCTEIGWEAYDTCTRCDYTTYVEIAALGHDLVHYGAEDPSCTEFGWEAYDTCTRCDYSTYEEIPAYGHMPGEPEHENEIDPTCTEEGSYDEVIYCKTCGDELSRETVTIPVLGHVPDEPVIENEIDPTYAADGSYDEVVYCTRCGEELERHTHTVDRLPFEATVEWNSAEVKFKGTTAYVIANGKAQTPRFTVKNKSDGSVVDPEFYDFEYRENTNAGTGYVFVTFKGDYTGTCRGSFKIYLQPTTTTTVANVKDGIRLTWSAVDGADGYVIYRRAWSSTTDGWTDFVRWNNTKDLFWTDTNVYAGTRYQYGIKAYFNKRLDPVTNTYIGGNVGDNYNLGEVGPLKTTVRITTRTLNSVTAGTKQMTVKWGASSVFTGYQIKYATDANFTKNVKAIKISDPKTAQTVISGLTSGTTYYVTVRSYHEFNGMTYFGEWSNVMSCKVK